RSSEPGDLPGALLHPEPIVPLSALHAPPLEGGLKEQVKAAVNHLERQLIQRALEQMGGNVTHTARLLKLSRKGLQLKMKELGLREQPAKLESSAEGRTSGLREVGQGQDEGRRDGAGSSE